MSDEEFSASIYMKTEPGGEYTLGTLDEDQVKDILDNFGDDEFIENFFYENPAYDFDDLGHAYGVATGLSAARDGIDEDDFNSIKYRMSSAVEFPRDSENVVQDGFYVVRTSTDKMSLALDMERDEPLDLVIDYVSIDLEPLEDMYGDIIINILSGIAVNGEVEDLEADDRGSAVEMVKIVQALKGDLHVIYESENGTTECWGDPLGKEETDENTPAPKPENNQSGENNMTCKSCGNELKPGAKFCGGCGTPVGGGEQSGEKGAMSEANGFIYWNLLPGQIALKIDESDLGDYGDAKGLIIQDGVQAMIFVEGKLSAMLQNGKYSFRDLNLAGEDKPGIAKKAFRAIA